MAIFDLFLKRQKRLRGEVPDVYRYDDVPHALKVQIIHLWGDTLGNEKDYYQESYRVERTYQNIVKILCRELGVFNLVKQPYDPPNFRYELVHFFLGEQDPEVCISVIELSFQFINTNTRQHNYMHRTGSSGNADRAIDELNTRFKEHGVGYQFVENLIVRVDSELLHAETVKPALRLLDQNTYQGAQEEFLNAFEHYRHGRHKEALTECLKAFESTMKSICDKRHWAYPSNATASALIQTCLDNGLVDTFWQAHFNALSSLLGSGVPTGRNKLSAHGQGSTPVNVPDYLVAYMLHMTASAIVFLTSAEEQI